MPDAPFFVSDPITGTQVIYAPQRAERSNAFAKNGLEQPGGPCPFCPGNEGETPPEVLAIRSEGSLPNTPGWKLRVVPNRYPAVGAPALNDTFDTGTHQVLIETPEHELDWTTMSQDQLFLVVKALQDAVRQFSASPALHSVHVFKNVGARAGASLAHPHLQILAMAKTPNAHLRELTRCQEWKETHNRDYWDHFLHEARRQQCVVMEDELFAVVCPPASRVPFETWLLPKRATISWMEMEPSGQHGLARHLGELIRRLYAAVGPVAHNVIWRLPPLREDPSPGYRWRIELLPRMTTFGGFELGAGIYSNPILPTVAARKLQGE